MPRYMGFGFSLGWNVMRPKWGSAPSEVHCVKFSLKEGRVYGS